MLFRVLRLPHPIQVGVMLGIATAFMVSDFSGNILAGIVSGLVVALVAPWLWLRIQDRGERKLRKRFFDVVKGAEPLAHLTVGEHTFQFALSPNDRAEIRKMNVRFTPTDAIGSDAEQEIFRRVRVMRLRFLGRKGSRKPGHHGDVDDGQGGRTIDFLDPVIFAKGETFEIEVTIDVDTASWPGGYLGIMCATQHTDRVWTHIPADIDPKERE